MNHRPCDDFIEHFLETQRLMANSYEMFPYEAEVERDRDRAASVSEPCDCCSQPVEEICPFCNVGYCKRHDVLHDCVLNQLQAKAKGE